MNASANRPCSLCTIVPAAGHGSRLGSNAPKVFTPLLPGFTIWDAIHEKLAPLANRIVLVLSPEGAQFLAATQATIPRASFDRTEIAQQPQPLGMGDAIFGASGLWRDAQNLLIVWGDQFNLSAKTLRACLDLHLSQKRPALTLPLVRMAQPYVEYVFDSSDRLAAVRQSREGDICSPNGWADMGVFLLTICPELFTEWEKYRLSGAKGSATNELNFLPFLAYLSSVAGWPVAQHECSEPTEALGINTPEDLEIARKILQQKPRPMEKP